MCDSAQTTLHICTHLVPINCAIIVDVQHTFHFDRDLILDQGQGHKKLSFLHSLYKLVLCVHDIAQTAGNCHYITERSVR